MSFDSGAASQYSQYTFYDQIAKTESVVIFVTCAVFYGGSCSTMSPFIDTISPGSVTVGDQGGQGEADRPVTLSPCQQILNRRIQ